MVREARLEAVESGLAPASPGWFVVNARDAAWIDNDDFGAVCIFEADNVVVRAQSGREEQTFDGAGFTLRVLAPGKPSGIYHAETSQQEDFLVLAGECLLLIEGEERALHAWDFVHCPAGTAHIFVGAGDGPCVLVAAGNRADDSHTVYPRSELALRHGAGVEEERTSFPHGAHGPFLLRRPGPWSELPWAE